MKDIRFAATVVGVALIISSCSLSTAISNGIDRNTEATFQTAPYENGSGIYQVEVVEGFLYLTDTESGRVWKKPDDEESQWVELPHFNDAN